MLIFVEFLFLMRKIYVKTVSRKLLSDLRKEVTFTGFYLLVWHSNSRSVNFTKLIFERMLLYLAVYGNCFFNYSSDTRIS